MSCLLSDSIHVVSETDGWSQDPRWDTVMWHINTPSCSCIAQMTHASFTTRAGIWTECDSPKWTHVVKHHSSFFLNQKWSISHHFTGFDWARIESITSMKAHSQVMLSPAKGVLSIYSVMTRVDYWNKPVFRNWNPDSSTSPQICETLKLSIRARQMDRHRPDGSGAVLAGEKSLCGVSRVIVITFINTQWEWYV